MKKPVESETGFNSVATERMSPNGVLILLKAHVRSCVRNLLKRGNTGLVHHSGAAYFSTGSFCVQSRSVPIAYRAHYGCCDGHAVGGVSIRNVMIIGDVDAESSLAGTGNVHNRIHV